MRLALGSIISNQRLWGEFSMPGHRSLFGGWLMWLNCPDIASVSKPGQFVMVRCGENTLLRRPLSINQSDGNKIALFYAVVGNGTTWLSECEADNKVDILGPLGNGFSIKPTSRNLLLVAGGMGIAPLYFLAKKYSRQGRKVILLYGTADDKRYPISTKIEMVAATEDGTVGHKGMITDLIPDFADWADQIFACGPTAMYRNMANRKRELKLEGKPAQISLETRMGCGRGICYACTIKTRGGLKKVCQDGPIFNLDDILWDEFTCN